MYQSHFSIFVRILVISYINVETKCLVNHSVVLLLGVVWLMAGKITGVPMSPW
jgi:hypothetical protein